MHRLTALALLLASLSTAACGGKSQLDPDPYRGGVGGAGSTTASSATASTGSTLDTSSTSSFDEGTTVGSTDATVSVGSTGSGGVPIVCGGQDCNAGQQCCVTFGGADCIDFGDDCQGLVLDCKNAGNCAEGLVCCMEGGMGGPPVSHCQDACSGGGPGPGGGSGQLCATDEECPPGRVCKDVPGGLKFCVKDN